MDGQVDNFMAITAADRQTAEMYMEMCQNDIDSAIQLYFENGGDVVSSNHFTSLDAPTVENAEISMLFGGNAIPESWSCQGLGFDYFPDDAGQIPWSGLGVVQVKNGPCGALVAFQSWVIAKSMSNGTLSPSYRPNELDICEAVTSILFQCKGIRSSICVCSWANPGQSNTSEMHTCELPVGQDGKDSWVLVVDTVRSILDQFCSPGGVILLVMSAMKTATADYIRSTCETFPLVVGPFHVCSCALVNLLLVGIADDNISAYTATGAKHAWQEKSRIGFLSAMEMEQKFLVMDDLKHPLQEVYVIHGRDHFTLCFEPHTASPPSDDSIPEIIHLIHWNGLPPGGPKFTSLQLVAPEGVRSPAPADPGRGVGREYQPVPNTIDTVIQADPADKSARPGQWQTWRYEVALTVPDPTNQSPLRPADLPPLPTFELNEDDVIGKPWRCRACFEGRFRTMCFGLNDATNASAGDDVCCCHCGGKRSAVGWTLWVPYEMLPPSWKGSVDRQHGPQIITVLRTKWPQCEVTVQNGADFPSV